MTSVLFLLLLLEGAARKWIAPEHHEIFYFLRDPFVLILYGLGLAALSTAPAWLAAWAGCAIYVAATSLLVYYIERKPLLVWVLGIRNYFMYIPLAFLIAASLSHINVTRIARLAALIALPVAAIQVAQFYSPPGSWINLGAGGAVPPALGAGYLRTTGLLGSDAQQVWYILFTLAACLAGFVGVNKGSARMLFGAGILASVVMMIVSGSRAVWMLGAVIFAGLVAAVLLGRISLSLRLQLVFVKVFVAASIAWLFSNVFDEALRAYEERDKEARTFSQATIDRIVDIFVPKWMSETSAEGQGIGIAMTGAAAIMTGKRALTLAEYDWDRNFVELGLIGGALFVGLRVAFACWLGWIGIRAARRGNPIALILASCAAPAILVGQITMHTVYAHLAWMAAGLTMAAARSTEEGHKEPQRQPPPGRASTRLAAVRSHGLRPVLRRVSA